MRRVALSGACVALLAAVAAWGGDGGGGGGKDRAALEAQLTKGPFEDYQKRFRGEDGNPLSAEDAKERLDCYADALLEYGDRDDLAAYRESGEGYAPTEFRPKADACLGEANISQYVPPYPVAALG